MQKPIKRIPYLEYLSWIGVVTAILYLKIVHHELWKDEWQAWFVAKDMSIGEILSFLYYEGHPALWYLYLKIFTVFNLSVNAATIILSAHVITVASGLYVFFVKFRLPIFVKILFSLSYFLFFEYGLINRGYFLVILLAFVATYFLAKKNYNKQHLGVVLFLLCQTEVYGVFMAIAFGLYMLLQEQKPHFDFTNKSFWGLLTGLIVFIISVFPRSEGHVAKTIAKEMDLTDRILTAIQGNLSNTYLIGSTDDTFTYGWTWIGLILSMLCLSGIYFIFKNRRDLLATFLLFFIMMLSFSILFFLGGIRQWGMGLVFYICLLEIRGIEIKSEKILTAILLLIGSFNIVHSFKAVREDIKIPFSNSKSAGLYIKEKVPIKVPIVAINKFEATPVIGYAERKFYELPEGKEFSYFRWVDKTYLPVENELRLFGRFKQVGGIIVISPKPLDHDRFPSLLLWQSFDNPNYKKENYYLYTLPIKTAPTKQ
ncbi:MAG: hypothetical protein IPO92_21455 [Saprospiraceae bacterium]|nr:hypothetical protein [Saprospiraceae bacterium]